MDGAIQVKALIASLTVWGLSSAGDSIACASVDGMQFVGPKGNVQQTVTAVEVLEMCQPVLPGVGVVRGVFIAMVAVNQACLLMAAVLKRVRLWKRNSMLVAYAVMTVGVLASLLKVLLVASLSNLVMYFSCNTDQHGSPLEDSYCLSTSYLMNATMLVPGCKDTVCPCYETCVVECAEQCAYFPPIEVYVLVSLFPVSTLYMAANLVAYYSQCQAELPASSETPTTEGTLWRLSSLGGNIAALLKFTLSAVSFVILIYNTQSGIACDPWEYNGGLTVSAATVASMCYPSQATFVAPFVLACLLGLQFATHCFTTVIAHLKLLQSVISHVARVTVAILCISLGASALAFAFYVKSPISFACQNGATETSAARSLPFGQSLVASSYNCENFTAYLSTYNVYIGCLQSCHVAIKKEVWLLFFSSIITQLYFVAYWLAVDSANRRARRKEDQAVSVIDIDHQRDLEATELRTRHSASLEAPLLRHR